MFGAIFAILIEIDPRNPSALPDLEFCQLSVLSLLFYIAFCFALLVFRLAVFTMDHQKGPKYSAALHTMMNYDDPATNERSNDTGQENKKGR